MCECSHTVSATDPQLTENILQEQIPFVLLHRTEFTRHFINTIVHLFRQGMLLYKIEKFANKMRQQMVATLIMQVVSSPSVGDSQIHASDHLEKSAELCALMYPLQSYNVICQCILVCFREKESTTGK